MRLRKIGDVARELGLSPRRLIEYERAGLLHPRREARTGDRLYDESEVAQARVFINLLHQAGFTIESLRQLLRYAPCWELTQCPHKTACPVPARPFVPCYEQRAAGVDTACQSDCARCPIFGSKDTARSPVVVPPWEDTPHEVPARCAASPGAATSGQHADTSGPRPHAVASGRESAVNNC
jgi:MerR family transcriptional regulator/heat shock protein HspR